MIRLFKKILYHSVYRKTVCAYALSLVVITILMLASVFGVMTSSMKQQTMNTSQQMLEQLVNSADRAQTDIANVMSVIAGSGNTLRVISEKEKNQEAIYSLFLELSNLKGFYSYIENISVWNLNSDVCVHILGDPDIGRENLSVAEEMQQEKQDILCRDISVFQEKINVISFFWYFPYQNSGIIIDVSSDLFQYSILDGSTDQREAYIIDAQRKYPPICMRLFHKALPGKNGLYTTTLKTSNLYFWPNQRAIIGGLGISKATLPFIKVINGSVWFSEAF